MKTFSECMKTWVHMVNEGRYFPNQDDEYTDGEQLEEGNKEDKVYITDIALGNAVDQIEEYFKKGGKVTTKADEAMSAADIMSDWNKKHGNDKTIAVVKPGKVLRMGTAFLGEKGPVGTVEVKFKGDKDFTEITINGSGPEGEKNIKLTNAEAEKAMNALEKKFGSKKDVKGIDGIIQAVREKLGDPSTDWFYYDSSKDDDLDDADDEKSEWQKRSEQNADDSGHGDDESLADIDDYANGKSDNGSASNAIGNNL